MRFMTGVFDLDNDLDMVRFFLRFGGTVPAQSTFIAKILYVKMIGIVMYMFSATTFFFLSSVQVSLRRLLRIRI